MLRTGTIGIALLALLLLFGCDSKGDEAAEPAMSDMSGHSMPMPSETAKADSSPSPSSSASAKPESEQKQYQLEATLQQDGDQYSLIVNTDLTFSQEHYGQAHQYGEGHIHFYVNNGLKGPIMANGPFVVDASLLNDGDNEIRLTLAGNDHSEPYNASATVKIEKKSSESK
ncbi:hypothetical protein [Cohnella mopanensis]|uniref:hypothetical protein n=1 Tax=Cohnella mopanensis TaxID=2911966 RepID=UPI001EF7AD8C|nr:hypothetical protein [Cohnella mopanensis]